MRALWAIHGKAQRNRLRTYVNAGSDDDQISWARWSRFEITKQIWVGGWQIELTKTVNKIYWLLKPTGFPSYLRPIRN